MVGKLPTDWNADVSTNPIAAQYEVCANAPHAPCCARRVQWRVRRARTARHLAVRAHTAVIGPPTSLATSLSSAPAALQPAEARRDRAALSHPSPPPPLWQLPPQILAQLFFSMAIAEGLRAQIIFKGDRPAGAP